MIQNDIRVLFCLVRQVLRSFIVRNLASIEGCHLLLHFEVLKVLQLILDVLCCIIESLIFMSWGVLV